MSQSNFARVMGNALLKVLNVLSPKSAYDSFRVVWYLVSSSLMMASIFEAEETSGEDVIPDGRSREMVWFVDS